VGWLRRGAMYASYSDITSRLGKPLWYDENGTPRYDKFTPGMMSNIYASEGVLYKIICVSCRRRFLVAESWHVLSGVPSLRKEVEGGSLYYGDPPYHEDDGHRCSGATMSSEALCVVEFWECSGWDWRRVPELEIVLPDDGEEGR
jgi:hypothetical protein